MEKNALVSHFNNKKNKKKKINPETLKEGGREGRLKALEYNYRKAKENPKDPERRKQLKEQLEYYKRYKDQD